MRRRTFLIAASAAPVVAAAHGLSPPPKKRCATCLEQGLRSKVYEQHAYSCTSMGISPAHWDEDGVWHPPYDPNECTYTYRCSNGHSWKETR